MRHKLTWKRRTDAEIVRLAVEEHGGEPVPPLTFIYFIQPVDGGPIKIGRATDPIKRLGELQVGNPYELRITRIVVAPAIQEKRLHQLFADARLQGEWFRPYAQLAAIADALADDGLGDIGLRAEVVPADETTMWCWRLGKELEATAERDAMPKPPSAAVVDPITERPNPEGWWRDSSAA